MTRHERPADLLARSTALATSAARRARRTGDSEALRLVHEFVRAWAAFCEAPRGAREGRAARVATLLERMAATRSIGVSSITAKAHCIIVRTRAGEIFLDCDNDPEFGLSIAADLTEMRDPSAARA